MLGNTEVDGNNGTLKNATIAVPLKYLSNFWRPLEIALINCKIGLKLKWPQYCAFSAAGVDNNNPNSNDIIFTIKDTKLCVPIVALSGKDSQKLSNFFSIGFEGSFHWDEYKTKSENKQQISTSIFSDQTMLELIDYLYKFIWIDMII